MASSDAEALLTRLELDYRVSLASHASELEATRDGWRVAIRPPAGFALRPTAGEVKVSLPQTASEAIQVVDPDTGMALGVRLTGSGKAVGEAIGATVVYANALGAQSDLILRPVVGGVEDYLHVPEPPADGRIEYDVELSDEVAGLRLVSNVLELLDENSNPRLRMSGAVVIDRDGHRTPLDVELEGCEADRNPADPWERPVTAPGATECRVRLLLPKGLGYPVLVDPAWTTTGTMISGGASDHLIPVKTSGGGARVLAAGPGTEQLYNESSGTWAATGTSTIFGGTTLTALSDPPENGTRVLQVGGFSNSTTTAARSYVAWYNTATGSWTSRAASPIQRANHCAALLADGRVLVTGGRDSSVIYDDAHLYEPSSNGWTATASPMSIARHRHGCIDASLSSGILAVGIFGGCTNTSCSSRTSSAVSWNEVLGTEAWQALPNMNVSRSSPLVLAKSTTQWVFGGNSSVVEHINVGAANASWTQGPSSPSSTVSRGAVLNGDFFVYAGGHHILETTGTDRWLDVSSPPSSGYDSLAKLSDGDRILVAGGGSSDRSSAIFERLDQGEACGEHGDCNTGYCVDGVCCESACTQDCYACSSSAKGSGSNGTCDPIDAGHSSGGDCTDNGPQNCDTNGFCDGSGGCQEYPQGTTCNTSTCSGSTETFWACTAGGTCGSSPAQCAGNFVCADASSCRTSCSDSSDCVTGTFCDNGTCETQGGQGTGCTGPGQCGSGLQCVDGFCCNSACSDQCEACDVGGSEGTCSPVTGAPHGGRPQCVAQAQCGGTCNGVNRVSCTYPDVNTACGAPSCVSGTVTANNCNGQGQCVAGGTTSCAPYQICADGSTCATSCSSDAHCVSDHYCDDISGECEPDQAPGAACTDSSQCNTGFCVDGVCCNSACTGQCEACKIGDPDAEAGQCRPVTGSPVGGRAACDGVGTACEGTCNGAQIDGCSYPNATSCGTSTCNNGIAFGALCNGQGDCVTSQAGVSCFPYNACADGTECASTCASSSQCATGYFCDQSQDPAACVEKKGDAAACSTNAECLTGFCVDGVCCESECDEQCEACAEAGSEGTCVAISGAPRGMRPECSVGEHSSCGATCNGSKRDGCSFPDQGTSCEPASCDGATLVEARVCDGAGACTTGETQACTPYGCDEDSASCRTRCESSADCAAGATCNTTSGECAASGTVCVDSTTVEEPNGTRTSCAPFKCEAGACRDSCATDADCTDDSECVNGTCTASNGSGGTSGAGGTTSATSSDSKDDGGCGCRVVGEDDDAPRAPSLLLLGAIALLRRRATPAQRP